MYLIIKPRKKPVGVGTGDYLLLMGTDFILI